MTIGPSQAIGRGVTLTVMNATVAAVAPLVLRGRLDPTSLAGQVVIVTGAGGGIGFEAARSVLALGGSAVIADIDRASLSSAERSLESDRLLAVTADVSSADDVRRLVNAAIEKFGKVDTVLNNATYAPAGAAVVETQIELWDRSYAVNLRGPALLARECLPGMISRRHGAFVCVSSTGGPYLAPYETLKAAQVALGNSLDAELAGTGVVAFTIGPGLVPTATAVSAVERIAPRLGMSVAEFWQMNKGAVLSVEAAGAGFAAAIAMAERYAGQEISSTQALVDAGIELESTATAPAPARVVDAALAVHKTLEEQAAGWKERSFFERQWMQRDFKQRVGMPVERFIELLEHVTPADAPALNRLAEFYVHMGELARGYLRDPQQREQQMAITGAWKREVDQLLGELSGS